MSREARCAVLFLAAATCWYASQTAVAAPGEGTANRAEVRQKILQKFDKNGNGQLDPDEREAAKEVMHKRREQGVGKGPGGNLGPRTQPLWQSRWTCPWPHPIGFGDFSSHLT